MYLAIDIETTGLDPEKHQVLEIGAVLHCSHLPVMQCPTFEVVVRHDQIVGSPGALAMNARLIERIANGEWNRVTVAVALFRSWIHEHTRCNVALDKNIIHAIGKNVGSFDLPFLRRLPLWPDNLFHYRSLDIGSMYATPEGMSGQSELADELAEDLNIPGNPHEALYDARVSLALARNKWGTL